jgi:hypothetical protein
MGGEDESSDVDESLPTPQHVTSVGRTPYSRSHGVIKNYWVLVVRLVRLFLIHSTQSAIPKIENDIDYSFSL